MDRRVYYTAAIRAATAVAKAVRNGKLPNLKKEVVKCSDCDSRAVQYDHRDYNQPLKVDPVCRSCNGRRGKAKFEVPAGFVETNLMGLCSVKLENKEYEKLREFAQKNGQRIQFLLTEAVREFLQRKNAKGAQ